MRLGGPETIKWTSASSLPATCNCSPRARRRFREDLYHRLNVIAIPLPSLRERREDVPRCSTISCESSPRKRRPLTRFTPPRSSCSDYNWPGNVRELETWRSAGCSPRRN